MAELERAIAIITVLWSSSFFRLETPLAVIDLLDQEILTPRGYSFYPCGAQTSTSVMRSVSALKAHLPY